MSASPSTPPASTHAHIFLFGEDQGRYLIATREPERVIALAMAAHVNVADVGVGRR